jgi:hypothetical protein
MSTAEIANFRPVALTLAESFFILATSAHSNVGPTDGPMSSQQSPHNGCIRFTPRA